jgi:hypothetical protein
MSQPMDPRTKAVIADLLGWRQRHVKRSHSDSEPRARKHWTSPSGDDAHGGDYRRHQAT